jgi:uncharacterized damage-inducible protein DinB
MATKAKKKPVKKRSASKTENHDTALRRQLAETLTWEGAHVGWKSALADLPADKRGEEAPGLPHTPWQLLEHARITQRDILDFCIDPKYKALEWPGGYWPKTSTPPDNSAWEKSVRVLTADTEAMVKLIENPRTDLFAKIPHGEGQTVLREAVLLADHNAYHLGQFVLVLRALGAWKET